MKLGSHVGMSGKEMLLGSAKKPFPTAQTHLCSIQELRRTQGAKKSAN